MRRDTRDILAILIVATFMVTTSLIIVMPALRGTPPDAYSENLKLYFSLSSGIVGVVVGYYFGSRVAAPPAKGHAPKTPAAKDGSTGHTGA